MRACLHVHQWSGQGAKRWRSRPKNIIWIPGSHHAWSWSLGTVLYVFSKVIHPFFAQAELSFLSFSMERPPHTFGGSKKQRVLGDCWLIKWCHSHLLYCFHREPHTQVMRGYLGSCLLHFQCTTTCTVPFILWNLFEMGQHQIKQPTLCWTL